MSIHSLFIMVTNTLSDRAEQIHLEFEQEIKKCDTSEKIEVLRIAFLGKKGHLKQLTQFLITLTAAEKKTAGKMINQLKQKITAELATKKESILIAENLQKEQSAKIDVELPANLPIYGNKHPLEQIREEILEKFNRLGFLTVEGNEIEHEKYNFTALNIPEGHPAREDQDSFYLNFPYLLRTQTSPVQIRMMEKLSPPIAIVSPGKVFRRDTIDASHSNTFHQIEGLFVDREVSFADLKGLLFSFCREMFGDLQIRFRPDYFPFTEPSCEISISSPQLAGGKWLEILGAGMVNPLVLKNVNIDPEKYSGFAFGMGMERIAMLKYGIDDIRLFYENDFEFLQQF